MLSQARYVVYRAMRAAGIERVVCGSRWRRERLTILCWHGIAREDEHIWQPGLFVSARTFERRLETLARGGYRVLPLAEALERLNARDLPPQSVAITFDDGFYDFYAVAAPLLRKYGFPATVYVPTYYVERQFPLINLALLYLFWKTRGPGREAQAQTCLREWQSQGLTTAEQYERLRGQAGEFGVDIAPWQENRFLHLMNAVELRELSAEGLFAFELHTHRHRTPEDRALLAREITDNRERLQRITGRAPVHFCYPSGVHRDSMFPVLREQGVISATTCEPGIASPDAHPLLLPRLLDSEGLEQWIFEGWLSGMLALLPHRKS